MKTNQTHSLRDLRNFGFTVRALIRREFALLFEQQPRLSRLALNEAEALAWETGFPQLTLPTLAVEKIRSVATWQERQRIIRLEAPILAAV